VGSWEEVSKRYVRERNEMLLRGSVEEMLQFMRRWEIPTPTDLHVAEITLHKAITAARSLPIEYRKRSKQWLDERKYTSHDDGDL